jgi:hypothetical protein
VKRCAVSPEVILDDCRGSTAPALAFDLQPLVLGNVFHQSALARSRLSGNPEDIVLGIARLKPTAEFPLVLHTRADGVFIENLTEGLHMRNGYMTASSVKLFEVQYV